MTKDQIKQEIIRYGNMLIEKGLCTGTGGNISVRLPENDGFMITPSGIPYPAITPEDIVTMDFEGNIIDGQADSKHRAEHALGRSSTPGLMLTPLSILTRTLLQQ